MRLYPAIDLRNGRVVRLRQGDFTRETIYADDPIATAQAYRDSGATWLHIVDLDGARSGRFANLDAITRIAALPGLKVQAGGGVRRLGDVLALRTAGVARVVVGSVAVQSPDLVLAWLAAMGSECLCIALDVRPASDGSLTLPTAGWTATGPELVDVLLRRYAEGGLKHLLCTDVSRDGMLSGPNLDLYRSLRNRAPGIALQASGGIRDDSDLAELRKIGVAGAVLGRALLEGRIVLREPLPC